MALNLTMDAIQEVPKAFDSSGEPNEKYGKPQFSSHGWVEPVIVLSIMALSLYFNRRKGFRVMRGDAARTGLLEHDSADESLLSEDIDTGDDRQRQDLDAITTRSLKHRSCFGITVKTPDSSCFANHLHSRVLQKLPFLVEMFYWVLNYVFYVCTKPITTKFLMSPDTVWDTARSHGVWILRFEHESWASVLFPIKEVAFQQWFVGNHLSILTFLNRAYSLVHIPGTVACIGWYYYAAPSHAKFAVFRRTMTLLNFISFAIFTVWPCMPPRLLPAEYGFVDTVHRENAESVWVEGKFVNKLAAMPSLHFGYSLCIGCTLIYHSGIFRRVSTREVHLSVPWKILYVSLGIAYPVFLLTVILATANHYLLDAAVATGVLIVAYLFNRVWLTLLPLEDVFLWILRLEKPVPTTGLWRLQNHRYRAFKQ